MPISAPQRAAVAILVVAAIISLALNWPGHLSYDSVVQVAEGRTGVYTGLHPPVMSWLLGVAGATGLGPALFIVFDTLLIFGALLAFVLMGRGASWLAAALVAACAIIPQVLIYPAIVWKDVLFAGAAIAGFAALAMAAQLWASLAKRYGLLTTSLVLLTLAALARQNGAVVLPFAAAAVGWIAASSATRARDGWLYGSGFLAACALAALSATAALSTHIQGEPATHEQWESLQVYDVVGAVVLDPKAALPVLHARAPGVERMARTDGAAAFTPDSWDSLEPVLDRIRAAPGGPALLAAQWRDLMLHQPLLYLRVRAMAFRWVFLTPSSDDCLPIYTGVDGPAEEMREAGLAPRSTGRDHALEDYAFAFLPTPIWSHAAFGALGVGLLALLLRRRRPSDIAVAAMIGGAITFSLTFAVISIACDYRYLYALDLSVLAASLYAAATWGKANAP